MFGSYMAYAQLTLLKPDIAALLVQNGSISSVEDYESYYKYILASYYAPCIILPIVMGFVTDYKGLKWSVIPLASSMLVGQMLFDACAIRSVGLSIFGRFLFGAGSEALGNAQSVILSRWCPPKYLGMFISASISIAQLGAVVSDILTRRLAASIGVSATLNISTLIVAICSVCAIICAFVTPSKNVDLESEPSPPLVRRSISDNASSPVSPVQHHVTEDGKNSTELINKVEAGFQDAQMTYGSYYLNNRQTAICHPSHTILHACSAHLPHNLLNDINENEFDEQMLHINGDRHSSSPVLNSFHHENKKLSDNGEFDGSDDSDSASFLIPSKKVGSKGFALISNDSFDNNSSSSSCSSSLRRDEKMSSSSLTASCEENLELIHKNYPLSNAKPDELKKKSESKIVLNSKSNVFFDDLENPITTNSRINMIKGKKFKISCRSISVPKATNQFLNSSTIIKSDNLHIPLCHLSNPKPHQSPPYSGVSSASIFSIERPLLSGKYTPNHNSRGSPLNNKNNHSFVNDGFSIAEVSSDNAPTTTGEGEGGGGGTTEEVDDGADEPPPRTSTLLLVPQEKNEAAEFRCYICGNAAVTSCLIENEKHFPTEICEYQEKMHNKRNRKASTETTSTTAVPSLFYCNTNHNTVSLNVFPTNTLGNQSNVMHDSRAGSLILGTRITTNHMIENEHPPRQRSLCELAKFGISDARDRMSSFAPLFWFVAALLAVHAAAVMGFDGLSIDILSTAPQFDEALNENEKKERAGDIAAIFNMLCAILPPIVSIITDRFPQHWEFLMVVGMASNAVVYVTIQYMSPLMIGISLAVTFCIFQAPAWPLLAACASEMNLGIAYGLVASLNALASALFPLVVDVLQRIFMSDWTLHRRVVFFQSLCCFVMCVGVAAGIFTWRLVKAKPYMRIPKGKAAVYFANRDPTVGPNVLTNMSNGATERNEDGGVEFQFVENGLNLSVMENRDMIDISEVKRRKTPESLLPIGEKEIVNY